MANLFSKIRGIVGSFFQIGGPSGSAWKNNAGVLEARNAADAGFSIVRVAEPVDVNDAVPDGDFLLDNEPNSLGTTYSNTFTGGKLTQEKWARTAGGATLKTIDYTYTGAKVTTEVRKVYASDGTTIAAQMTVTYTYTGSTVTGETLVRDV